MNPEYRKLHDMSRAVSLHIGLEKTGTTSIQKRIGEADPNLRGKGPNTEIFSEIRRIMLTQPPTWWESEIGQKLTKRFNLEVFHAGDGNHQVISFENLIAHDLFLHNNFWNKEYGNETWNSIDHLRQLIARTFLGSSQLELLITVRRQDSWLASLYAQRSDRIPDASQENFDFQLTELMRHGALTLPPLNLERLILELEDKISPTSITLLAAETLSTNNAGKVLSEWAKIREENFDSGIDLQENVRSTAANSWKLRIPKDSFPKLLRRHEKLFAKAFKTSVAEISLNNNFSRQILTGLTESNLFAEGYAPAGLPGYQP